MQKKKLEMAGGANYKVHNSEEGREEERNSQLLESTF